MEFGTIGPKEGRSLLIIKGKFMLPVDRVGETEDPSSIGRF
jgi:hypothetical protein